MSDTKPKDAPKPITIASLSAGEKPRRNFLVFGTGPRKPGDEPRFIATQEEADEAFGVGLVAVREPEPPTVYVPTPVTRDPQWDAMGYMLPWMTAVPVPPPEVPPRGLYAEPVGVTPIGVSIDDVVRYFAPMNIGPSAAQTARDVINGMEPAAE